jgi:hypothetical protein
MKLVDMSCIGTMSKGLTDIRNDVWSKAVGVVNRISPDMVCAKGCAIVLSRTFKKSYRNLFCILMVASTHDPVSNPCTIDRGLGVDAGFPPTS